MLQLELEFRLLSQQREPSFYQKNVLCEQYVVRIASAHRARSTSCWAQHCCTLRVSPTSNPGPTLQWVAQRSQHRLSLPGLVICDSTHSYQTGGFDNVLREPLLMLYGRPPLLQQLRPEAST